MLHFDVHALMQVNQQGDDDDGEEMQAVPVDDGHGNVLEFMQKRVRFGHITCVLSCCCAIIVICCARVGIMVSCPVLQRGVS